MNIPLKSFLRGHKKPLIGAVKNGRTQICRITVIALIYRVFATAQGIWVLDTGLKVMKLLVRLGQVCKDHSWQIFVRRNFDSAISRRTLRPVEGLSRRFMHKLSSLTRSRNLWLKMKLRCFFSVTCPSLRLRANRKPCKTLYFWLISQISSNFCYIS